MAQQIQFIYLTQSDYDNLTPQTSKIYFTSDTHRIYKGSDLYAATTFDQLNFNSIEASSITVDGSAVSLEGHTHAMSDITDLDTTAFASSTHTHPELSGITQSTITKDTGTFTNLVVASASFTATNVEAEEISASTATFGDINVTGTALLSATNVSASNLVAGSGSFTNLTVGGSGVALVGHTHTMSEIEGLASGISGIESSISTIESSISTLESSVSAMATTLSGVSETGISKQSATFQTLTVTGEVTMSLSSVDFQNINASSLTVNGSAVSLEGHSHSASEISGLDAMISAATSSFATSEHTHVASEITDLDTAAFASSNHTHPELSGLTSSTITKDTGTFTNLVVANASLNATSVEASGIQVNGSLSASTVAANAGTFGNLVVADAISASIATFGDIVVSGSATFSVNSISVQSATVNGKAVSLEGHGHSVADIDGLSTALGGFASSGHTHSEYASIQHSHSISDIANLETTLSAFASSGHTHEELAGITSTSISKANGSFNVLTASTATFGSINVTSSATFDITNLVADTITVSDLDLTGTLTVSSTAVSSMTVTDLSVTGTLMLNNKSIAT